MSTKSRFEFMMMQAEAFYEIDKERVSYWKGYMQGLRRAYHGEKFGTAAEHQFFLSLITDPDADRQQIGIGYRDGLAALGKNK